MSIRPILIWPDRRLYEVSKPVENFGPELMELVSDMWETMYHAGGAGLAAIQIGVPLRVFVASYDGEEYVFINPTWNKTADAVKVPVSEGCLSVPNQFETVERWDEVYVKAQGVTGKEWDMTTLRFAQVIQHETEHLDGQLFLEHLTPVRA